MNCLIKAASWSSVSIHSCYFTGNWLEVRNENWNCCSVLLTQTQTAPLGLLEKKKPSKARRQSIPDSCAQSRKHLFIHSSSGTPRHQRRGRFPIITPRNVARRLAGLWVFADEATCLTASTYVTCKGWPTVDLCCYQDAQDVTLSDRCWGASTTGSQTLAAVSSTGKVLNRVCDVHSHWHVAYDLDVNCRSVHLQ